MVNKTRWYYKKDYSSPGINVARLREKLNNETSKGREVGGENIVGAPLMGYAENNIGENNIITYVLRNLCK